MNRELNRAHPWAHFRKQKGHKARVKATIKAHEVYAKTGEPNTVVTRVDVVEDLALEAAEIAA